MNTTLIYPMFALFLITFVVFVTMFLRRRQAVRDGKINIRFFKDFNPSFAENSPEDMIRATRHFTNLFEVPVLFYTASLIAMQIQLQTVAIYIFAWTFVAARGAHAFIHLGNNRLYPRMISYALGWTAVGAMWIHIALSASLK